MKQDSLVISESIFEIRHEPSGIFLDKRGYIADHIRGNNLFNHWQIENNLVQFRDDPKIVKKIGGFVGYKSIGLFCFDPETSNLFEDKAIQFWNTVKKNQIYQIPELLRFGCRTKAFISCDKDFKQLNKELYSNFFSDSFKSLVGKGQEDLQIVIRQKQESLTINLTIGPVQKNEAGQYFNFENETFEKSGIYIDIDVSNQPPISHSEIKALIKKSMSITWDRIDEISKSVGL